jgi:hypothetical protein
MSKEKEQENQHLKNKKETNTVINLSNQNLTPNDITTLNKGLTFAPTPGEPDMGAIAHDLESFFRRLRLRHFFFDTKTNDTRDPFQINLDRRFRKKSDWTPKTQDDCLESFIKLVRLDFIKYKQKAPSTSNITATQKTAIRTLALNPEIVVKKADKGSAVCIMDTKNYIQEATRQLSDPQFYTRTSTNLTDTHVTQINDLLYKLLQKDEITDKIYDGLTWDKPRTAKFYLLPKIHKGKPKEVTPGRPIISGNGSPTEKISAFVDEHIKSFVPRIPSYVRDTTDFINKVTSVKDLPENYFIVTMDVTSLYTNIPNHEGMTAVAKCLRRHQPIYSVSHQSLLQLLKLVLHCNNFEFNGTDYLQIGGTAMGTKLAPSYANIFMGELECDILRNAPTKPILYLRYIDDIFMIYTHSEQDLLGFIQHCNSAHPTIKFTAEYSRSEVTFLDTRVKRDTTSNELYVDLYTKPTDTHSYLRYDSAHPSHCKDAGPYSQFLRLRRNCSRMDDFLTHAQELTQHYINRGYPQSLLQHSLERASQRDRHALLHKIRANTDSTPVRIPLIVTYNPANPHLKRILRKHWHILEGTAACRNAFAEFPLVAFRRPPILSQHLVKAKIRYPPLTPGTSGMVTHNIIEPCTFKQCTICPDILPGRRFISTYTKRMYTIKRKGNCCTRNLVYLLTCSHCLAQYVGETKRPFRVRLKEHLADVKYNRDQPVARHFNKTGHSSGNLIAQIIEIVPSDPDTTASTKRRRDREHHWIYQLHTLEPLGINQFG